MKADKFIQLLRSVIREEVSIAVRTELNMVLNESKSTRPASAPKQTAPVTKKPIQKKTYTSNPVLNDILNETSGFTPEGPMAMQLNEMHYSHQSHDDFGEWPTMARTASPMMQAATMLPSTDSDGRPVNMQNVPDHVVGALTKDYRSLMKAIDKKKGL